MKTLKYPSQRVHQLNHLPKTSMSNILQNALNFTVRLLMAALFRPAGVGKLIGFSGAPGCKGAVPADQAMVTQLLLFKNIAVAGDLLGVAANSAGGWRLDARRPQTA